MRTSTGISCSLPTGRMRRSSSTRSSVACSGTGRSPISSRNSVPPCAYTNRPSRPLWRAVGAPAPAAANTGASSIDGAPLAWPNNSLSICSADIVAQFTGTNGPAARGLLWCSASAANSLPVPDSPVSSTVLLTVATRCSAACRPLMAIEPPTSAPAGGVRASQARRSTQFSRCSRARSSPCLTALRICVTRNGLRMKSLAPARSASIAVSRSANAVISTTSPA